MLRIGDKIRLSEKEKGTLDIVCGGAHLPAPTTVTELDTILDNAKAYYEQDDSAEAKLLAHIAQDIKDTLHERPLEGSEPSQE